MKYDVVSFIPDRGFRPETRGREFETDHYCLSLDGALTLYLKADYLNRLLGDTPPKRRQIRKWYFYTAHLNCLYLLLDSLVVRDLQVAYFDLEEITTKNADVVSANGVSISPRSHQTLRAPLPEEQFVVPNEVVHAVGDAFLVATREVERIYVLSELAKSLASYKSADFTTSLVLSWFLIERFIEAAWARHLDQENLELENGERRINAKRRQTLNDHRSYPVAVKLQTLELAKKISFDRFSELDLLRRKRNDIVHPRRSQDEGMEAHADAESCGKAFALLEQLIEAELSLRLALNTSYSHIGVFDR